MSRCMITMMRMMKLCDGFNQKEQRHIGSKRTFTFVAKKGFFPNARWTMHEYRLNGIYANTTNNVSFYFILIFYVPFLIDCLYCTILFLDFLFPFFLLLQENFYFCLSTHSVSIFFFIFLVFQHAMFLDLLLI